MTLSHPIVFLLDVDNTLLDNDGIQQDLKDHLERAYGRDARSLLENPGRPVLGTRLPRLSRTIATLSRRASLRSRAPGDVILSDRLSIRGPSVPIRPAVLKRLKGFGPTVILSDGDVVFQPHKVERAGLSDAVDGRVLIYIHKEEALDDVERRFPAEHYAIVDEKLRILAAVKRFWGDRVTPCSCGREPTLAIRKWLAPFRRGHHNRTHRRSAQRRSAAIAGRR